ncbi:MAG: YihY/virulence factor BrkB family protein [Acidobacteriaceae bacterium]|nr:YihY/virulence factor BrkB family protein [Acidobacteriaceae bacterium]
MPSLWKFGGLTPLRLVQLGIRKLGEDELSTRSAALSYYFLLSLFPMLLFVVSLLGLLAGPGSQLRESITAALGRLAPGSASALVHNVVTQTSTNSSGVKLAAGILGALWAASGGMGGVVDSLNVIYRVKESRAWWKQKATIIGLTLALSVLIIVALVLALYGGKIGQLVASEIGLGEVFRVAWKILQWLISFFAMFLSYSTVYYFAPDLGDERKWHWVTPGAVTGVALWLIASFGLRVYLHFFDRYSATYGSLGAVVILMLWLYITGFAILFGGEINWIIENEDRKAAKLEAQKSAFEAKIKTA